jgi:hypothetical protein
MKQGNKHLTIDGKDTTQFEQENLTKARVLNKAYGKHFKAEFNGTLTKSKRPQYRGFTFENRPE